MDVRTGRPAKQNQHDRQANGRAPCIKQRHPMSGAVRPDAAAVDASGLSLAIAATRWHAEISDSLVARATAAAVGGGAPAPLIVRVPGAIELPVVAAELALYHDAVACLGVVIRGGTPHFTYVCDSVTAGATRVALAARVPGGNC